MSQDLSDDGSDHISPSNDDINNLVDDNEEKNDNDSDDNTGRRIDPATSSRKRVIRNPIPKLNPARLRGPKGIHTIEKYFDGFKFNDKGHEKNDLDRIMKRLEHWAHRIFPKYRFDDFIDKIEILGTKREMQTFLTKYRRDLLSDDAIVIDMNDDVIPERQQSPEPVDEFDLLIAEQIEKTKQVTMSQTNQINVNISNVNVQSTTNNIPINNEQNSNISNVLSMDDDVKKRIERNRQLAIERRHARLKRDTEIKKIKIDESTTVFNNNSHISDVLQSGNDNFIDESEVIHNDNISHMNNKKIDVIMNDTGIVSNDIDSTSNK